MVSLAIEVLCRREEKRGAISWVTIIKAKGLFNCNDTTSFRFLLLKSASCLLFSHSFWLFRPPVNQRRRILSTKHHGMLIYWLAPSWNGWNKNRPQSTSVFHYETRGKNVSALQAMSRGFNLDTDCEVKYNLAGQFWAIWQSSASLSGTFLSRAMQVGTTMISATQSIIKMPHNISSQSTLKVLGHTDT